jgi:hypothetical protein
MFKTSISAAGPTHDVVVPADDLIPLSHLALDLAEPPAGGWHVYLAGRGVEITLDDIGRPSVTRTDARMLITERHEAEARKAQKLEEAERAAVEQDRQRRASIWGGIPADMIPVGVSPAQAMVLAEKDARPRRRSVLEDSLSNSGTVFHPIRHEDESS